MKKTISQLNESMFYRLLKVVTVVILIFITFISVYLIYDMTDIKEFDHKKVTCLVGNEEVFTIDQIYEGMDIYTYPKTDKGYEKLKNEILKKCEIDSDTISVTREDGSKATLRVPTYDVENVHKTSYINILKMFGYWLIALLAIGIVFEVIRRIFYYVVTGTFNPKKENLTNH